MMGYMTVQQGQQGAERVLYFAPSPSYLAKDSGQIGNVILAPMTENPTQLGDIIQATKDHINSLSDEQVKCQQDLDELRSELMGVESVDELNAIKDSINDQHPLVREMKQGIMGIANNLGFVFNRELGKFEVQEQENA